MLPPSEVGLPDPENVFLPMKDGIKVNLWLFLQPNSKYVPTVIFFHGNAGNMSFRNENFKALYSQCEVNVLAVEYRGFGLSDGVPGQASLISDAVEVFDWISAREEIDPTRLVVLGRSIGGAVAIHLAQKRPQIAGLILENTFTTVSELIDRLMPNLRYFKFLLTNPWRNEDIVPSLSMPVLFLCSQKDEMIPEEMMKRLHEKFGGNDKLVVFFAQANVSLFSLIVLFL